VTWYADAPQGFESDKVRLDVLRYATKGGIDIGCGPKKVWPHFIGVDSGKDTDLFGIAMKPDIVVSTAERLALFADASMDCVFSSHTLEHIENHGAALQEWWRLVKVGGCLVLYLPHRDLYPNIGTPGANPDHKHDFVPDDILEVMRLVAADCSVLVSETRSHGLEYSFLQVFRKEPPGTGFATPYAAPRPQKTAAVVRVGAHGDALWASSPVALLKEQGYHVTVYTATTGGEILRHDPNIDELIVMPDGVLTDEELLAYWANEAVKYDRWINLVGSVENRLLAHVQDVSFYLPDGLRRKLMGKNYLEMVHDYADLPYDFRQRFYPSAAERAIAEDFRRKIAGPMVVIAPGGSSPTKTWPYTRELMRALAERGVYSVVLGNLREEQFGPIEEIEPHGIVLGMQLPVRVALAVALTADAVVATESLIANAVAFEPMLKVVTLSHSSHENLTKHWVNTAAIEPERIACHPCHRIHGGFQFCSQDRSTGSSACQAAAGHELVAATVLEHLSALRAVKEAA
jgi:ADP-heptose:LPS heptosyltransferase/predicted SAM-dependent methyltransferase